MNEIYERVEIKVLDELLDSKLIDDCHCPIRSRQEQATQVSDAVRFVMQVEAKDRLKWAREILLIARNKLVVERDRATHGHAIDMIQIITMVDAASLVCKEVVGEE